MEIPEARLSSDQANSSSVDTHSAMIKIVADAISTAVGLKTNSCTFSTSGKAGADVMNVLQELKRKGNKVSVSGTTVTVAW